MAKTYVPNIGRRVFQRPAPKPDSVKPGLGSSAHRNKPRGAPRAAFNGRLGFPGLTGDHMDSQLQLLVAVGSVGSLRLPWIDVVTRQWSGVRADQRGELARCVPEDWFKVSGASFDPQKMKEAGHHALRALVEALSARHDIVADGGTGGFSALAPFMELGQAHGYHVRCVILVTEENMAHMRNPRVSQPLITRQVGRVKRLVETWPGFWPTPEVVVERKPSVQTNLREWGVIV